MNKYLYFIPRGGLNDCCIVIEDIIKYCKKYERILLLDWNVSRYKINFSKYFDLNIENVIFDSIKIKEILNNNNLILYPKKLEDIRHKLFNDVIIKQKKNIYSIDNIELRLPKEGINENIIFYISHNKFGKPLGNKFFSKIILKDNFKKLIINKIKFFKGKKYICIQVRNTDHKCNYRKLFDNNEKIIKSYDFIYLCTDNKKVLEYFKSKNLNVHCYTTFPKKKAKNLHCSNLSGEIKMLDLFTDIYLAINSDLLLSNSIGGFIRLLRYYFKKNKDILKIKI